MSAMRRLLSRRDRPDLVALSLWTLFCALFFATLIAGRERLPDGDFSGQFHAFARFQAAELLAGRFPLWTPGTQSGFPFYADPQSASFYPLRWLTILASAPWGLSVYVLQLEAIFHVWLAGLFTYLLAFDITHQRGAALVAAVAFGLGGYLTSYPILQLAVLETIAWLPLVLWLVRRAVASPQPAHRLLLAGLVLALSFTAGHPQTFLHVAYLVAAYYLFQAYIARWSLRAALRGALLLGLIAAGAAAVTWLPAVTLARYSTRAGVSYQFVAEGQPLLNTFQLLLPGLRALWSPEYAGLLTLLLALVAWSGRHEHTVRAPAAPAETWFWALAALLAAWMALGDSGLLFQLAYHALPGFSLFRQQERLLSLASLALALLAAQGAALCWQLPRAHLRRLLAPAIALLAAAFFVALTFIVASPDVDPARGLPLWLRQVAIALLTVVLLTRAPRRSRLALLLLLLLGDLYLGTYSGIQRQPVTTGDYWQEPPWLRTVQAAAGGAGLPRFDSANLFYANIGVVYGLEDVHTADPLKLQPVAAYESLPPARRWQLLGVTHLLSYAPPDAPAELVGPLELGLFPDTTSNASLYRISGSLPRAWVVYDAQLVASPEAALAQLQDPLFAAERQVLLHTSVPGLEAITPPATAPAVSVERLAANRLRIAAESATPGLLVISEWAYPGWRARLDGEPVSLFPANYALNALHLPPGSHTVELYFFPADLLLGLLLTTLTLVLALVLARRPSWTVAYRPVSRLPWPALPAAPGLSLGRFRNWLLANSRPVALLLLAGGGALRLAGLGVQELRGDEAFSYLFARPSLPAVLPALVAAADPHPPLHYLLLHLAMRLFGDSELALRLPSALAGILLLAVLFQLGRSLLGRDAALVALLLAALSPSLIWLSQDVRSQYMLVVLFTALATWLLLRAARRPHWFYWLLYALSAALTMYAHYYGLFALLAHGLFLLAGRRRLLVTWLLAGLLALALFAPWLLAGSPGWRSQLVEPGALDFGDYLLAVGQELSTGPAIPLAAARWLALLAFLLAAAGFRQVWSRRPAAALLLAGWFLAALWGIYLVVTRRATFNPFYIAVAAPPWLLLASAGIARLWRSRYRRAGPPFALAGLLLLTLVPAAGLARYYGDPFTYGRSQGYRALAAHLAAHAQPGDLIMPNFPDPSLSYYLRSLPQPQQMLPASAGAPEHETEAALADLVSRYPRIWLIPYPSAEWDAAATVFRWLDYHTVLEQEHRFADLALQGYRPLPAAAALVQPLDAALADSLRLDGVWLTAAGRPLPLDQPVWPVPAGAPLNVSLVWQATAPVSAGLTVFVHLLAEDGRLLAQHDGVPAHGTRPTSSWEVGEPLLDEHLLEIPAGALGPAWLFVGMYDPATLDRQPFAGGATELLIGQLDIVPRPVD